MCTYVGGSKPCIAALIADHDLEAMSVSVDQGLTYDTDTVNPAAAGSSPYHS